MDYLVGMYRRGIFINNFNEETTAAGSPIRARFKHKGLREMDPHELARNHTFRNKHTKEDPDRGVGLDVEFYHINTNQVIDVEVRFQELSKTLQHYIKCPGDEKSNISDYLNRIKGHTIVLFVRRKEDKILKEYSNVIPLEDIMSKGYGLDGSRGNENRITFDYKTKGLNYYPLTTRDSLFKEDSTLVQIEKLFK